MAEGFDFQRELKPRKGLTKSVVWNYFGFLEESPSDKEPPLCRLCWKNEVKLSVICKGGNTSNLFSHLRHHHPTEFAAVQEPKGRKGAEVEVAVQRAGTSKQLSLSEVAKYNRSSKRWHTITNAVTNWLAKDMQPIYSVEKNGFKQLIKVLDSKYELPGRKYFSQVAIPKLYAETKELVAGQLCDVKFFSATTDLWSSSTMEPYISLTVHFVTSNWTLESKCLQVMFIPEDHTGKNIADALTQALDQWKLQQSSLVTLTTDNGTNMISAGQLLGWRRISCFGHNLHLAVTNSTKNDERVGRAIGICKKLVSCFSHSWKKRRELALAQEELNIPKHTLLTVSKLYNMHSIQLLLKIMS